MRFDAVVEVRLRAGVADPEGATIQAAVATLGYSDVLKVQAGKSFHLELEAADEETALQRATEISKRLLANPVLEDAAVRVFAVKASAP